METAGRPSGFAPAALSCLWASALTRVSGCPRHGEVRTAGEEPLAVLKPTGWQFLNRTGEGLFLEVQADGSCTGGILAASGRARCRGTPSLASGGAPGAGRQGFPGGELASQGPMARSVDVSVVPRRLGLLPESSVWRPGALLEILRLPSQHRFTWSGPRPRPSRVP